MRHEHLVVTVEAGRKERIDADLDAGESLEAWVADAIEQKLAREAGDDSDDPRPDDSDRSGSGSADSGSRPTDSRSRSVDVIDVNESADSDGACDFEDSTDDRTDSGGEADSDDYEEGFEYVDDCAI